MATTKYRPYMTSSQIGRLLELVRADIGAGRIDGLNTALVTVLSPFIDGREDKGIMSAESRDTLEDIFSGANNKKGNRKNWSDPVENERLWYRYTHGEDNVLTADELIGVFTHVSNGGVMLSKYLQCKMDTKMIGFAWNDDGWSEEDRYGHLKGVLQPAAMGTGITRDFNTVPHSTEGSIKMQAIDEIDLFGL